MLTCTINLITASPSGSIIPSSSVVAVIASHCQNGNLARWRSLRREVVARSTGAHLGVASMRDGTYLPHGPEIRRLRVARGWTQADLAKETGIAKRTVE